MIRSVINTLIPLPGIPTEDPPPRPRPIEPSGDMAGEYIEDIEDELDLGTANLYDPEVPTGSVDPGTSSYEPRTGFFGKKSKSKSDYVTDLAEQVMGFKTELVELKKELSKSYQKKAASHISHAVIEPPSFPVQSSLDLSTSSGVRLLEFHAKNLKFNGKAHDGSINDFLRSANRANDVLQLNEKDFLKMMVSKVSDSPRNLFEYWVQAGYSARDIYNAAYSTWNQEISCSRAVICLGSYTIPKNFNIAEAIADISHLSLIASLSGLDKLSRDSIREGYIINTLLNRMPKAVKKIIEEQYIRLSQQEGKAPNSLELTLSLVPFHNLINDEITSCKEYTYSAKRNVFDICKTKSTDTPPQNKGKPSRFGQKSKVRTLELNALDASQSKPSVKSYAPKTPRQPASDGGYYNVNLVAEMHPKLSTAHILALNDSRKFNTNGIQGSGKKYCTFCAGSNHGSEAGCYSMVNDQLRHVYATPSMKYCDVCFEKVKKKLHHNSKLCPLRPQLMEAYKRGQLKPLGIFKAYVEKQNPSNK